MPTTLLFRSVLLILLSICATSYTQAQTYPFARLTGSPSMDTRGWNLTGDARIGDTNGDGNAFSDEMILCSPTMSNSGACFYNQPVNIASCQRWVAEFDYRIFDGTGADGIAFCFLSNPPTGFTIGGNIGIPSRPQGLMVILDTWLNCPGSTPVPKLEIRFANGRTTYGNNTEASLECPFPSQPTSSTIPLLRQPNYNRMKITYTDGDIQVFINNTFYLSGFYKIDFPGYFGFTASTGGSTDRHSIRDFVLYTFKPIVSPPNAGPDRVVCSGDSVQIGVPALPGDAYTYTWFPATGLNSPAISNPKVRLTNNLPTPVTYTYFVTKDSLVNENLCAYSDAVQITVLGKAAQAGPDLTICSGEKRTINGISQSGYQYTWSPATGLSNATLPNPEIKLLNNTGQPVTYQYKLKAININTGCATEDTLRVTVTPQVAKAGPDIELCTGESRQIGTDPLPGYRYTWLPATGLSNSNVSNPTVSLNNTSSNAQIYTYVLLASATGVCSSSDTVSVTVLPSLSKPLMVGPRSVCPDVRNVVYSIANTQPAVTYQWAISGGTIKSGQGSPQIEVDWGPANATAQVSVTVSNAANCTTNSNSIPVNINVVLDTEKPASPLHPDTLCLSAATGIVYELTNTTGSVYNWGISANGTITNGQGTNRITVNWTQAGRGKIWVNEQSTTSTHVCFGTSDTLDILIAPMPEATNQINGNTNVCAGTSHTYSINGFTGSAFVWNVTGGTITNRQGNTVTVNWQAAGSGNITVQEVTQYACAGNVFQTVVAISPLPSPRLVSSDVAVCPQRFTGLSYQVTGSPGSAFSWTITNGQIITSNPDSSAITVNWDGENLATIGLLVEETSLQNCSAVLNVPLLYDASTIVFQSVSVQPEDERNIVVNFQIKDRPAIPNTFTISRRTFGQSDGEWSVAGTVSQNDTQFTDLSLDTDNQSYEYKIEGKNRCDVPLATNFHHSIVLNVTGNEEKGLTSMNWNGYTSWENGVKTYEIWRKLDDENQFSLYATVSNTQLTYVANNAKEGFTHCYRIRAIENSGFMSSSWSNEVCIEYVHALYIPNVITPNQDEKNDFWVIENLELYPQHQIFIYNRLGKEIYQTNAYRQNWNADGLTTGIYYFLIQTRRRNQTFKGWIHVIH